MSICFAYQWDLIIIINSNMSTNKTGCKIWQFLTFLLRQFIEVVLLIFAARVFAFSVDTVSITIIISSR